MANPFTYDDKIALTEAAFSNVNLKLTQWAPQVLRYGRDLLVWSNFLPARTELGKGRGDTIRVPIFKWVTALGTTALTEGTSIPIGTQTVESVDITIDEYGRGLSRPREIDYFTNVNNERELLTSLSWNYAQSWDAICKSVFESTVHAAVVTSGTYDVGTENFAGLTPGDELNGDVIDALYDKLKGLKVPTFPDGLYRFVSNAAGLRAIKNEAGWENLQLYNQGGRGLISQELGAWKGFRFIETEENMSAGTSFAFGMGVGAQAFGLPMQIRYEPDYQQDFQRFQAFAWYLIGGVGTALRDKGTHCIIVKHNT